MTQSVNDQDFDNEVMKSDVPVLVDFWAEWCGPCRILGPIIDELSKGMSGKVKIMKMNIDENPESASKLGIRSIPTMMFFKEGKMVESKIGVHSKTVIEEWISSNL